MQDIDIIVDSEEFRVIDVIEDTLIRTNPRRFRKLLSPSNLLKVHYVFEKGHKVRLDIYNTTMRSTGLGHYHRLKIHRMRLSQQLEGCPEFECPVATLNALVDMKLVAELERSQMKHFEDVFFALWTLPLNEEDGLPYYADRCIEHTTKLSDRLGEHARVYAPDLNYETWPNVFRGNLIFWGEIELKVVSVVVSESR
jgi:hypothetical protein